MKKAIVLVSGGLDSATCLAIAQAEGFECFALSFDYGQRSISELQAARELVSTASVAAHKVIPIDMGAIGGSALTDRDIDVPVEESEGIPVTYVPARNTVFLSYALAWAEVLEAEAIFIGVNAAEIIDVGLQLGVDYSMTVSCYQADSEGRACGVCDSCRLRKKGFADAGGEDVTRYQ